MRLAKSVRGMSTHGKLHHIGVGRIHTGTHVMLVHELHVRVVQAATGELLRDFTLDPTRDFQPTGAPKGGARPIHEGSDVPMSRDITVCPRQELNLRHLI